MFLKISFGNYKCFKIFQMSVAVVSDVNSMARLQFNATDWNSVSKAGGVDLADDFEVYCFEDEFQMDVSFSGTKSTRLTTVLKVLLCYCSYQLL